MGNEITYVIGHKNPDTDSICSAIGLAELKTLEGAENTVAARAGDINPQTSFILDYFKVQPPRYLPNVYPKASDIMTVDVVKVTEQTPLLKVMEIMREERVRFVPVLDPGGRPQGILTLMDLAKKYIVRIEAESAREVKTSLKNIIEALGGEVILDFMGASEVKLSIYVGAMAEESFRAILEREKPAGCAIVVGDRTDIQKASIEKGVGLIIVTGGFAVKKELLDDAKRKKVTVLSSPLDSAATALLLRLSTPAYRLASPEFETVSPDDPVEDIKFKVAAANGVVVLDGDGVMRGVITKSNILKPSSTNLVLVDHNELSQAVDGADRVNILEVIDHHRIGNFHSPYPIPFICEP
ncbi:MAG: CBS domain-containing protein, partial [Deltaproteobacteria bacterium]|nr:CBS domain-containing protein [Deltaproteobacteria bacterium]